MAKNSSTGSAKKKKSKGKINKKLSSLNSDSKKIKGPKENPFENIWSRRKFTILGKKRKDEERRRIGLSRSLAIQKRQKTLLKEYEQSTKSSTFVDKRIGEQNEGLEEFDKAILRSQRERQLKLKKKSKFNLSDGEEDDFEIQGGGYFPGRDDFEDDEPFYGDDYDDDLPVGQNRQFDPHEAEGEPVSGSAKEQNRPKTKKEVMEDIIFKSKFFKAQKAKEKEESEQFTEQLDKDFASLVQSEALLSLTQPNKMSALNALVNSRNSNDNLKEEEAPRMHNKVSTQHEKPDHYDKLVGEMALDMRARPSDRTKAPEELAQEEKERLERLEEERRKRMAAGDDSNDEDAENSEDADGEASKQISHVSGDDLGDSFSEAIPKTKAVWIDDLLKKDGVTYPETEDAPTSGGEEEDDNEKEDDDDDDDDEEEDEEEEGSEESSGEDEKAQSLKDWEQSDEEQIDSEDEEEDNDSDDATGKKVIMENQKKIFKTKGDQNNDAGALKVKTIVKEDVHKKGELPYTIEAPKNFEEFSALMKDLSDDQVLEAIRRIRTYNAIAVAAENRKKMQVFYGVLLQYFAVLACTKPLNLKLLNLLAKPLMEMSTEIPYFAAICARQRLLRTRTLFCQDIKITGNNCWPSLKTLFLMRLWSMIFPCSDFRHAVMTPAILLISEYLMRCPITSGRDIAIGSFLCSLLLSVSRQSQKFCPEAITFLQTMLMAALTNRQKYEASQLCHLMELKALRPLLHMQGQVEEINSLDFLTLMDLPDDSPYFTSDNFRASILCAIIRNLKGFVDIYEGFKSFPEIFLPMSKILHGLAEEDLIPDALKKEFKDVAQLIETKSEEFQSLRLPLRIRKQKVIKTAIPKFEDNFVKGRDYDPDRERVERKKLKKQLQQEVRGAVRELRKDNHFLFEVKEREKARMQEEKTEMYGKYRAFLQEQEHAFKSGQLGKNKKRRR
ncbi:nucleolar protein 14-like isoform X2 [Salvia splendens]|uniref:nucleolar protein 14-like isoform X2 n=1 Tax=Salvia splendens TaxID=180675 RepID=UPI001C26623A|nr:nucleolar protein 14-like isoform X2 [Salvia splendens]